MRLLVSGKSLYVSAKLWLSLTGPRPPRRFECDGCSWSPDVYFPLGSSKTFKLWPACVIHDYHYRTESIFTRDAAGRAKADRILYENLKKCVAFSGGGRVAQHRLAWLYWGRVRIWGASAFQHWREGEEPEGWLKRVREVWG